ncbi:ATP-binding protein [Sinomicrobium oceani]|uniref:ATP-binding protein n=1 Tax=Sinomicrobium oceani TaxID=1150368 RepID=UPI00227D48CE|nr:ATP-binding protein [Sinomicrobium oceani]
MEKNTKLKILDSIGRIYDQSEKCKLEDAFFDKVDHELDFLSEYFRTSKSQAFFIALVFTLNYKGETVSLNDLIKYFDCNPVKILEHSDDFDFLYASGIFEKQKSRFRAKQLGANDRFTVNKRIPEAILQNKPMPEIKQEEDEDIVGLLEKLYNFSEQRADEEILTSELFIQVERLISSNLHYPLLHEIEQFKFSIKDTYLFLYVIRKTLSGDESTDIGGALEDIYSNPSERMEYMQKFLSGENVLVREDLVEIVAADFFNDTEIKLTDKSHNLLNECGINLFLNQKKKKHILLPSEIPQRELIFCESEMKSLLLLKSLLGETKFMETQKRLSNKNLPKGITALLHGTPGTGKTEVVKQLSRETNRELMKVEISRSKSMWYGESEKIVKRIFTDYRSFAKRSKHTPILLFNEADAIISKRRTNADDNIAQTENAIQNIILEELENFEGILMATTNLVGNLDTAFERRFLFKIKFQKPSISIRKKIWKSKLPYLRDTECTLLADQFDFSGGQIDNILRKKEIHEIIYGEGVSFDNLFLFCSEENLRSENSKIGFTLSK